VRIADIIVQSLECYPDEWCLSTGMYSGSLEHTKGIELRLVNGEFDGSVSGTISERVGYWDTRKVNKAIRVWMVQRAYRDTLGDPFRDTQAAKAKS
jgi:hypothetical protein